ncbi:MAG: hypothetical protein M3161_07025, partial [Actinomycetota bacterium]|nr:hypothetical protein [Actinomycetota bacterium]
PILGTRAPGPTDDLRIKAPAVGEGKLRTFLARGRTAEQRMADYIMTLELKAEMRRARGPQIEDETGSEPVD